MTKLKEMVLRVASGDDNILIIGEPGTGKELVSKAIHDKSSRSDKPFHFRNFAGEQSDDLINSLLFGIEKGRATNVEASKGYLRECEGGTLVIDEIGDLSYDVQTKLLRAIEYKVIEPVGASNPVEIDVRILGATNKNLHQLEKEGKFRRDFLSRFSKLIEIPPLRDRGADIDEFINYFASDVVFTEECIKSLRSDSYEHANVRELLAVLKNATEEYEYEKRPLNREDIPKTPIELLDKQRDSELLPKLPFTDDTSMKTVLESIKYDYYEKALRRNDGVRERAAKDLNMEPHTLRKHLRDKDSK